MKKFVIVVVVVGIAILIVRGCGTKSRGKDDERKGSSAVPVTATKVVQKDVPVEFRTFGTVQALSSVAVKSQIGGILTIVHVEEGQDVKEGDLLFTIDPRPQEAALKQAEANLARDTAQFDNARKEATRQDDLLKKGLAAEDADDQAKTTADSLAAVLQADEAAVTNAQLQLEYSYIRSPVAGRAGELKIHQGNLIKASDIPLITINQIIPIQVSFSLPQQELPEVMKQMAKGPLQVRASIPGNDMMVATGQLTFVDNQVDSQTGTIGLKGTFPNAHRRLWPGLFVNVVLTLEIESDALVIPTPAVQTGQKGTYVFVVRPDMTVEDRVLTIDRTLNEETVVAGGLRAGELVVTDGQLRLSPGVKVEIKPAAPAKP